MKGSCENLGMGLKANCHTLENELASSADKESNQK